MVSGIAGIFFTFSSALILVLLIRALCKWNYIKGRAEGMRDEALAWCAAYDQIRPPNWQSIPIPHSVDREKQEAANRLYVEVFKTAKEAIGQELVVGRLEALRKEWMDLGILPSDDLL